MRTPRKLTALILMGALAVSSVAVVPAQAKTFNDVPSNHWAYKVVDEVSNRGIMIGTGTGVFSPNTQLTRAEYATVLANLATDKSNGRFEITYTDVPSNAWYASTVEWVVSRGLFTVKGGKFEPNKPISRELMADMTYKFIYYLYTDQIVPNTSSVGYADEAAFSSEYAGSINALTHNGLLSGRGDNKFEPQGTLTRAEAAAMASRLLAVVEKGADSEEPGEPSEPENPGESDEPNIPSEPENPGETVDQNNPANWDLDGAPEWFLVGRPDRFTESQWNELIDYWKDKESIAHSEFGYPSKIPSSITSEEGAKAHLTYYLKFLYNKMIEDQTEEALLAGTVSLSDEEQEMVTMLNNARKLAGVAELKVSPALCRAADIRAEEVIDTTEHVRPNGEDISTVLSEESVGFNDDIASNISLGENLTVRYNNKDFPAFDAFSNFKNSPEHNQNMLNYRWVYLGIGSSTDSNTKSWIQLFGIVK